MKQPPRMTYTEAVVKVCTELQGINDRLDAGAVIDAGTVKAILSQQEETNKLLREQNGTLKEHGNAIAAFIQWKEDHEKAHQTTDDEIKVINRKTNVVAIITGAIDTALLALVAIMQGNK